MALMHGVEAWFIELKFDGFRVIGAMITQPGVMCQLKSLIDSFEAREYPSISSALRGPRRVC